MNDMVIAGIMVLFTILTGAYLELCDRLGR